MPGAIHAFVNVFLSGIHSRLEQDLRIYLGTFLFFFLSFLPKLRPGWLLTLHYFVLQSFLNTLTKRLTVLACSDNTKDVRRLPLPFSIFGSFYPNVRFIFYVKILVGYIEGGAKKPLSSKKNHNSCFFFCWRSFLRPPLSGALGDRLYRL